MWFIEREDLLSNSNHSNIGCEPVRNRLGTLWVNLFVVADAVAVVPVSHAPFERVTIRATFGFGAIDPSVVLILKGC